MEEEWEEVRRARRIAAEKKARFISALSTIFRTPALLVDIVESAPPEIHAFVASILESAPPETREQLIDAWLKVFTHEKGETVKGRL